MFHALKDEIGTVYGELTVIKRFYGETKNTRWLCKCTCGNETNVRGSELRRGAKTHCGCLTQARLGPMNKDSRRQASTADILYGYILDNPGCTVEDAYNKEGKGTKLRNWYWALRRILVAELVEKRDKDGTASSKNGKYLYPIRRENAPEPEVKGRFREEPTDKGRIIKFGDSWKPEPTGRRITVANGYSSIE